jgi:hypothetical protein
MSALLVIGTEQREALALLRGRASENPVDIVALLQNIRTPEGKKRHKAQMNTQSLFLPTDFLVTFSIETGHGAGTCRHMSMSVGRPDRVPHPAAVWMVAEELGFVGGLDQCMHYIEQLEGHGEAVNVIQPVSVMPCANA